MRCIVSKWILAAVYLLLPSAQVAAEDYFERLEVKGRVFTEVRVKEATPEALFFVHKNGLAKVFLADLPADLQERYGYKPEAAAAHREEQIRKASETSAAQAKVQMERLQAAQQTMQIARMQSRTSPLDSLLARFGTPAPIYKLVDMRQRFPDLYVRDQGRRPSCAVFAVVSALEYQNAVVTGVAERLSEEYLIWATRKTLGLQNGTNAGGSVNDSADADAGFDLYEVVQAVRSYGIPTNDRMPYTYGRGMNAISDPPPDIISEAQRRRTVNYFTISGRSADVRIANIIHTLNDGIPVVIGIRWPHWRTLQNTALLSNQTTRQGYAHAVTLMGYKNDAQRPEDTVFIFKNSWGNKWGSGGYGSVTYGYLYENLLSAVFLEVK